MQTGAARAQRQRRQLMTRLTTRGGGHRTRRGTAGGGGALRPGVAALGAVALGLALSGCGGGDDGGADPEAGADRSTPAHEEESEPPAEEPLGAEDEADAGGGAEGDADGAGDAETYVVNFYGEENIDGNPEQQPENLVLSEHTSLQEVDWEEWDGEQAVGSGLLSGMWCLPECLDEPFDAVVTLSDPQEFNGEVFYTTFLVESAEAEPFEPDDLDGERPLAVPED